MGERTTTGTEIADRLARVRERIAAAEARYGRAPDSVTLLAVSKVQPAAAIVEAQAAGQTAFGESYVQEALDKRAALAELPVEWHFIGRIQTTRAATSPRASTGCTDSATSSTPAACRSSARPRPGHCRSACRST
jgi:uncharacterized pyridoxal phosphate-containing UPF0001 family protein